MSSQPFAVGTQYSSKTSIDTNNQWSIQLWDVKENKVEKYDALHLSNFDMRRLVGDLVCSRMAQKAHVIDRIATDVKEEKMVKPLEKVRPREMFLRPTIDIFQINNLKDVVLHRLSTIDSDYFLKKSISNATDVKEKKIQSSEAVTEFYVGPMKELTGGDLLSQRMHLSGGYYFKRTCRNHTKTNPIQLTELTSNIKKKSQKKPKLLKKQKNILRNKHEKRPLTNKRKTKFH